MTRQDIENGREKFPPYLIHVVYEPSRDELDPACAGLEVGPGKFAFVVTQRGEVVEVFEDGDQFKELLGRCNYMEYPYTRGAIHVAPAGSAFYYYVKSLVGLKQSKGWRQSQHSQLLRLLGGDKVGIALGE